MGSEPERSRQASYRWVIYAAVMVVALVALYFVDRPLWQVLERQLAAWAWFCLVMWQRLGGFARGWEAAERERVRR